MRLASESSETRRRHRGLLDRRLRPLLEVAQQPASGDALVAARVLLRDQQRQLKRLVKSDPSFAVTSATSRFPCSSARQKTVRAAARWPPAAEAADRRARPQGWS